MTLGTGPETSHSVDAFGGGPRCLSEDQFERALLVIQMAWVSRVQVTAVSVELQ